VCYCERLGLREGQQIVKNVVRAGVRLLRDKRERGGEDNWAKFQEQRL
jgi:hypothetical protein